MSEKLLNVPHVHATLEEMNSDAMSNTNADAADARSFASCITSSPTGSSFVEGSKNWPGSFQAGLILVGLLEGRLAYGKPRRETTK